MSELQQLPDGPVAAGAPGAAGRVGNERGSLGAASGLANRRTRQPMRPELRFRAGSMTKPLVAAAVLFGLVVEAASHRTLGQELSRSILGPLGLRDTVLPDSAPDATAWDSWRSSRPPALLGNAGGIPGFLSTHYSGRAVIEVGERTDHLRLRIF